MSSVTGLDSGMPKIALDEVCTTFSTPASRAARSTFAVPSTFTDQNSSRSRANGTWATLCRTASIPSQARAQRGAVAHVALHELDLGVRRRRGVHVEDANPLAAGERLVREHAAEVATARR